MKRAKELVDDFYSRAPQYRNKEYLEMIIREREIEVVMECADFIDKHCIKKGMVVRKQKPARTPMARELRKVIGGKYDRAYGKT